MPIQITSGQPNTNPMVISQTEYELGRSNFRAHYFLSNCNTIFGGQDIQISWDTLYNSVMSYINQYNLDPSTVAVRFVHCYDMTSNCLFLRMQLCTMVPTATQGTYDLNTTPCAWFTINGQIAPTGDTTLLDAVYFDNLYYCDATTCDLQTLQQLAANTSIYIRNLTYPWQNEILTMYQNNGSPQGASICFGACSYVRSDASIPLQFPHGLVMYLKDSTGQDMLNDQDYISMFYYKGADYGTCCPPHCDTYITPTV